MLFSTWQIKSFSWYYPLIITFVLVTGVLATVYTYIKATSSAQETLLEHVSVVANTLESHHIITLSGSEADLIHPDYIILKKRFQKIKELSDNNIRYIYLTGYRNGQPFFFADSEPESSLGYAPPGLIYGNASPTLNNIFSSRRSIVENVFSAGKETWLSALAPVIDPETDHVVAVLGMDLSARQYYRTIYTYSILPASVTSFFAILLVIGYIIRKREQQLLSFKSELVSIASHEIRTPLTGISWVAESLLQSHSENLSAGQKEGIRIIEDNSWNLLATINDLLDFSAAENIKSVKFVKQQIFLPPFIEELAKNFELSMRKKNVKLVFDPSFTSDTSVFGDRDRLRRLFNNLISNAIKYSEPDSTITVGSERREKSLVFWIKDRGIGIPQKDQERVFNGFYRAENAKKITESGTGLGLLYVRQIAELHRGRVWCESKENIGSTFFVEFPKS